MDFFEKLFKKFIDCRDIVIAEKRSKEIKQGIEQTIPFETIKKDLTTKGNMNQ